MTEPDATPAGGLVGVGIGPGDPELITVRALRVLGEADRVLAPSSAVDAVGRAESVVRQACPGLQLERLAFEMGRADRSVDDAAATVVAGLDAGQRLAFVTLGDPNVYSTFTALAARVRELRPGATIATVPGIMAFQDLASRAGTVVLQNTERLALVTALDGPGDLDGALRDPCQAVVVYKGGRHLPAMAERLAAAGRLDGAVVGELLGLPGQRILPVAAAADAPAAYLATVIVPPEGRASGQPAAEVPVAVRVRQGRPARKGEPARPVGERSELDRSEPEDSPPKAARAVPRAKRAT